MFSLFKKWFQQQNEFTTIQKGGNKRDKKCLSKF